MFEKKALMPVQEAIEVNRRHWIHRHSLVVRIIHWIAALAIAVLLMSGLQIFNAHPALYWGKQSDFGNPILAMKSEGIDDGQSKGVTTVSGRPFGTTGLLVMVLVSGVWNNLRSMINGRFDIAESRKTYAQKRKH